MKRGEKCTESIDRFLLRGRQKGLDEASEQGAEKEHSLEEQELKILVWNIEGLNKKKQDDFKKYIYQFDFICFSESWCDEPDLPLFNLYNAI